MLSLLDRFRAEAKLEATLSTVRVPAWMLAAVMVWPAISLPVMLPERISLAVMLRAAISLAVRLPATMRSAVMERGV